MKRLILFIIVMFCFTFVGCSNDGTNELTDYESHFVDSFEKQLDNFKYPESVSVVSINSSGCEGSVVEFVVSAKNSLGEVVNGTYVISTKNFKIDDKSWVEGYFVEYDIVMSEGSKIIATRGFYEALYMALTEKKDLDISYNVEKINEALKIYKESKNWL